MLDDLIDEELLPSDKLQRRIERCQQILDTGQTVPSNARDPLTAALHDIHADLARYPLFSPLAFQWTCAISQTMHGMLVEDSWRAAYRASTHMPIIVPHIRPTWNKAFIRSPQPVCGQCSSSLMTSPPWRISHISSSWYMKLACVCG